MAGTDELQVDEDLGFQRSEWRVQRVGWGLWALVVLAALVGLLGPGPLSSAEATSPDGSLAVSYDRFLHSNTPSQMEVQVAPGSTAEEPLRLDVSRELLDSLQIMRIEPEPEQRELREDGIAYTFLRAGAAESMRIVFHVEYLRIGGHRGRIELPGRNAVEFSQFVYP
jgi:hypothetical protein